MSLNKLNSTAYLKQVMADYYRELAAATNDAGISGRTDAVVSGRTAPVAWCSSVGPVELLRAMGFAVYFPENHAAMLGASRQAADVIPQAVAGGFSPEICSYLTSDIGAFLSGRNALGGQPLPRPDVLVYNTNQCRDIVDWFAWFAKQYDVPLLGVQSFRALSQVREEHVASLAAQFRQLAVQLAPICGHPLDEERLTQVLASSRRTSELWGEVLQTARQQPSPLTFFDACTMMGPAVVLRGSEVANEFYRQLLEELNDRIFGGEAAVSGEHFRLYWEGMPIWGRLRSLAEFFAAQRTCVAVSTYCNSWVFSAFDERKPFESMARAYLELFITRDEAVKERIISQLVSDFHIDGIVFHNAKTCPYNSNSRYGMPERLRRDLGIPCIVIDGDLNDLRLYSEARATTQLEALLEMLGQRVRSG